MTGLNESHIGEVADLGNYLWDALETNYTHGKYQFAFLAYRMLTMSFVYFNIGQIRQTELKDFGMGLIGFGKDIDRLLPWKCRKTPESTFAMTDYSANISCNTASVFVAVFVSSLPSRLTRRVLSTVRIWSRTIWPFLRWKVSGMRVG